MDTKVTWRVDELLRARGWTVVRLAAVARLDPKTVRNIVNRRATRVDLETIGRLSEALDVAPGDLLAGRRGGSDRSQAWESLVGIAGHGRPGEFDDVDTVETNPGLERATRP